MSTLATHRACQKFLTPAEAPGPHTHLGKATLLSNSNIQAIQDCPSEKSCTESDEFDLVRSTPYSLGLLPTLSSQLPTEHGLFITSPVKVAVQARQILRLEI